MPEPVKIEPDSDADAPAPADSDTGDPGPAAGNEPRDNAATDDDSARSPAADDADDPAPVRVSVGVSAGDAEPVRVATDGDEGPDDSRSGSGDDDNSGPGSGDDRDNSEHGSDDDSGGDHSGPGGGDATTETSPAPGSPRRSRSADQPLPMNGMVVAVTVMNCTLASSGSPAMNSTASATCRTSNVGSGTTRPSA